MWQINGADAGLALIQQYPFLIDLHGSVAISGRINGGISTAAVDDWCRSVGVILGLSSNNYVLNRSINSCN
jgi:hypothetical protein